MTRPPKKRTRRHAKSVRQSNLRAVRDAEPTPSDARTTDPETQQSSSQLRVLPYRLLESHLGCWGEPGADSFNTRAEAMEALLTPAREERSEAFDACYRLLRCFWELWEGGDTLPGDTPALGVSRFKPRLRVVGGEVLLFLAARATRIFHALVELAWSGFAIETGALARMLFETTLDIYWASANKDVMVERFDQHLRLSWYLQHQRWAKYPDNQWPPRGNPEPPPDLEALQKLFGQYAERHWSGLGIRRRVEEGERLVDDPFQLRLMFDIVHPSGSEVVHSTSISLTYMREEAPEPGVLRLDYGPSPFVMGADLAPAFWCYAQVLKLIFREFDVDTRDELEALIEYEERRLAVNLPDLWPDAD